MGSGSGKGVEVVRRVRGSGEGSSKEGRWGEEGRR